MVLRFIHLYLTCTQTRAHAHPPTNLFLDSHWLKFSRDSQTVPHEDQNFGPHNAFDQYEAAGQHFTLTIAYYKNGTFSEAVIMYY